MAQSDELVEVLKEIRDELRAVRTELGARGGGMATDGIRTERMAREGRWRSAALAAGGVAGLALVIGLVMRDRPAPVTVAVAPPVSATRTMPAPAVIPPEVPVALAPPVATRSASPAKSPAAVGTPSTKPAARLPAEAPALAAVPVPSKKRVKPAVAAKPPVEFASDEDEALAFPPPPKRVRVHRLSYGPVGSEPAKL